MVLSRCGVKCACDATKQYSPTGVRLKRLRRSKLTLNVQQTDPLLDTMDVSNQRGRPRKKKEQRKNPPPPIRVRAAAAKRLGKHKAKTKHTPYSFIITITVWKRIQEGRKKTRETDETATYDIINI